MIQHPLARLHLNLTVSRVTSAEGTVDGSSIARSFLFWLIAAASLCGGCKESTGPDDSLVGAAYVHTRASWAPDGRTIAFRGEFDGVAGIYLVDSSGANRRLLLGGEGVGFTWSPDSRWLAFSSLRTLYKVRVSGDSLTQLTPGASDIRPSWSPDGRQIAFVRTGIWLLMMDSLTTRQISTTGDFPGWDPNGSEIVVMVVNRLVPTAQFRYSIEAVDIITGTSRSLYSFESPDNCGFGSMSPAGEKYVFSVQPYTGLSQVWVVDLTTSVPTRLTSDGGDYPAWSPDGGLIAYTRTAEGDGALWVMRADGSGKRRLTSLPAE